VLILEDGSAIYDSPVIVEYLDHLAGGGKIIPREPQARFDALKLQALADGILDASILIVYEGRYRPVEKHEQKWLDLQGGKVDRALAALEAAPPTLNRPPNIGQISVACALGYREFRFPGTLRKNCPKLSDWLDRFAAQVPSFEATKPPPA
jgi:glutathione S-transferase